uniref:Uncharacterized protein n=1 Tax=Anabas testudineus TaxID=64144 RepID=A0A7N6AG55_ANATE
MVTKTLHRSVLTMETSWSEISQSSSSNTQTQTEDTLPSKCQWPSHRTPGNREGHRVIDKQSMRLMDNPWVVHNPSILKIRHQCLVSKHCGTLDSIEQQFADAYTETLFFLHFSYLKSLISTIFVFYFLRLHKVLVVLIAHSLEQDRDILIYECLRKT